MLKGPLLTNFNKYTLKSFTIKPVPGTLHLMALENREGADKPANMSSLARPSLLFQVKKHPSNPTG